VGIDWKEVEKLLRPVPSYEELIKRLNEVLSYNFTRKTYNHARAQQRYTLLSYLEMIPNRDMENT
jgi:hypothetical protein